MISRKIFVLGLITSLPVSLSGQASALGFGCAGVAGEVVFLDTLYGTGTGTLVAGVLELTRDEHDDWGKRLATGAAIGAGVGLALGFVEVAVRDCSEPTRVNHTWRKPLPLEPKLIVVPPSTEGDTSSAWAGGIQLSHAF